MFHVYGKKNKKSPYKLYLSVYNIKVKNTQKGSRARHPACPNPE